MIVIFATIAAVISVAVALQCIPNTWDYRPSHPHPTETMEAIVYHEHGDLSVLRYEKAFPKPVPRPNQYLIQVKASALNPVDFKMMRSSDMPQFVLPLPKIMGCDLAGVVVQTPTKANTKFKVGDRVVAMMPVLSKWGSHAEYAAVDERFLVKFGDHIDFETAAAVPLAALTVYQKFQALASHGKDETTEMKLLVHAGAGGVGSFAIQWGKLLGMYVATTASAPKANTLKKLGADLVIDYKSQPFEEVCREYDVVLDPMSWLYEEASLKVLKPGGYYLNIPSSDWGMIDGKEVTNGFMTIQNYIVSKLSSVFNPSSSAPIYSLNAVSPNGADLQVIMDLVDQGKIRPLIDRRFQLSDAMNAYKYLEEGHATGKVILQHEPN